MPPLLSLALLALAVSIDGFGVGVMYGLRNIRIPLVSIAIISVCSGLVIYASMQAGAFLAHYLPQEAGKSVGAAILIGIGVWAIVQMRRQKRDGFGTACGAPVDTAPFSETAGAESAFRDGTDPEYANSGGIRTVVRIELKRLGLVVRILRTPPLADMDRSGNISSSEAVLLGCALSLDAFGAGVGAAFVGFPPLATACFIACASGFFVASGLRVGMACADSRWLRNLSVLPGFILIAMGILKLM